MNSKCANTPMSVHRHLRQEAYFGCCRCGNPILDNAHNISSTNSQVFLPEDMLSFCPPCHRLAHTDHWSEKYLRDLKANPYNKLRVDEQFKIEGEKLIFNVGGNRFVNAPRVLIINDFEIAKVDKESRGHLTLNLTFYDRFNKLVGIIDENKWAVDSSLIWDLEYKQKHLKIKNPSRQISFNVEIRNSEVYVRGNLFFVGQPISINDDKVLIETRNIFGTMKGCTIEDGSGYVLNVQLDNSGQTAIS